MSPWDSDGLYQKAKLCVQRAQSEEAESSLRALWSILALEYLARAALARIHPVLLADPRDHKNILFAFGVSSPAPKSIPAHTVFSRCEALIPDFQHRDYEVATALAERRNEELHSAVPVLDSLPTRLWLADYYRIARTLTAFLGVTLPEFLGNSEGRVAGRVLAEVERTLRADVERAMSQARRAFAALTADEQHDQLIVAEAAAERLRPSQWSCPCPACGSVAVVDGETIRHTERGVVDDNKVAVERTMLPMKIWCRACGLRLNTHGELAALELGGEHPVTEHYDILDYYGIEAPEPDYSDLAEYDNE